MIAITDCNSKLVIAHCGSRRTPGQFPASRRAAPATGQWSSPRTHPRGDEGATREGAGCEEGWARGYGGREPPVRGGGGRGPGGEREDRAVRTHGLRFDVNCSILFTELPLLKRPEAARAAGFGAVEFW